MTEDAESGEQPAKGAPCRHDSGFTLIEVLVALAILGLSLAVLLRLATTGLHFAHESEEDLAATGLAQSLLARVGPEIPLVDGEMSGRAEDDMQWHLRIAPFGDGQGRPGWAVKAKTVSVTVRWGRRNDLSLTTLRLLPEGRSP